jgi:CHAD domain-containing protein
MRRQPAESNAMPVRAFAGQQAAVYLRRFAFEVNRAAKHGDADAIHDLRVSSRRLAQCLRVFGQFFPGKPVKKIRRSLKKLLDRAAEVRNRDIALSLLVEAGADSGALAESLGDQRERHMQQLSAALKQWARRNSFRKWRAQLGP